MIPEVDAEGEQSGRHTKMLSPGLSKNSNLNKLPYSPSKSPQVENLEESGENRYDSDSPHRKESVNAKKRVPPSYKLSTIPESRTSDQSVAIDLKEAHDSSENIKRSPHPRRSDRTFS